MYYGWRVVAGTLPSQMFVAGFFAYSISFFIQPIKADFGVSLEQIMYSFTVGTILGIVVMPLCGVLLDRISARFLMCTGTLIYAGCLWWLSLVDNIIGYIVVFAFAFTVSQSLGGPLACATVISRWFSKSRGKALGISATGVSLGGVLMPPLVSGWIEDYGWRQAMEYSAIVAATLILPLLFLSIRSHPSDVGLEPEPEPNSPSSISSNEERALSVREITAQPAFWYMGLGFAVAFSAYLAVLPNLTSYALDMGLSSSTASSLLMLLATCSFLGKLFFGIAADKVNVKLLLWTIQIMVLLAFIQFAMKPAVGLLYLAYSMLGLAIGGMIPLMGAMVARIFGIKSFGRTTGIMTTLFNIFAMPSFLIIGRLYDSTGDYTWSFIFFSITVLLGAIALAPLKVENIAISQSADSD